MSITEIPIKPYFFEEAKRLIRVALRPYAREESSLQTASDSTQKGRYHFVEEATSLSVSWENIPNGDELIKQAMYEEDAPTTTGVIS